jgi:riboflavin kinase/FMN adenylyltransferase
MPSACVLTVGKFEGIHLGHQKLISEVVTKAKQLSVPSAVITFAPHPNVLFGRPDYKSLFTIEEREYILAGLGIDYLLVFPFDSAFAARTPEQFAELLFADLHARVIFVGEGFRYGSGQQGTEQTLRAEASRRGTQVITVPTLDAGENGDKAAPPLCYRNSCQETVQTAADWHQRRKLESSSFLAHKISTSNIRVLLANRELTQAANVMGFPFFIMGTVAHGKRIGSRIGYPTVNILPPVDKLLPPDGVYATATFIGGARYASVTNVGLRPTVNEDTDKRTVESHLIGFGGDLYGAAIRTEFNNFIRPELKFNGIDELRERIAKDVEISAQLFD